MSEFVDIVMFVSVCLLIYFLATGFMAFLNTPKPNNHVYDCRYSCQQLKNTANSKCDVFDIQTCFSDCLELMTE